MLYKFIGVSSKDGNLSLRVTNDVENSHCLLIKGGAEFAKYYELPEYSTRQAAIKIAIQAGALSEFHNFLKTKLDKPEAVPSHAIVANSVYYTFSPQECQAALIRRGEQVVGDVELTGITTPLHALCLLDARFPNNVVVQTELNNELQRCIHRKTQREEQIATIKLKEKLARLSASEILELMK